MGRALTIFMLLPVTLLVLAPVGAMAFRSLRVEAVDTTGGERIAGRIHGSDEAGVEILPAGARTTRLIPRAEVAWEGKIFSLRNYATVLGGQANLNMFLATFTLAAAAALLALLLGLPVGILLGATNLPARGTLELLIVLPLVLPPILLAIATYHDLLAVRPEFLRAVLVFGLSLWPLVALFCIRSVRSVGAQGLDAARLQTAPREALFRIALAPALPGAAAGALLVFAFVVADFAVPDFLGVTTAKNTISVYANTVMTHWRQDDSGAAAAAGMVPTLLCLVAFALVLRLEHKREAATLGQDSADPHPLPLGRARVPAQIFVWLLLAVCLVWPMVRHLETTGGAHFGTPVARQGANPAGIDIPDERQKPTSVLDGLRKSVALDGVGLNAVTSLVLAGGGALLAVLLALALTEAGRGRPRLDRFLLVVAFLPVAVPPMVLAVGWVLVFGRWMDLRFFPAFLLGARLLPFAALAVRSIRRRLDPALLDAAATAGLGPWRRFWRVTFPLIAPGAALGFLLAFLFGLREVDAIVFTRGGAETLPVQMYNKIHYGYDVQVAGLAFLWTAGLAMFLLVLRLLAGRRLRWLP